MNVYHGSSIEVKTPDVQHSFRSLDFGKGFYVTTNREQAVKWAKRKSAIYPGTSAVVSTYEMAEDFRSLKVKMFNDDLADWIDFVCRCRDGSDEYLKYDLIIGKVANDKVFRVVDMYHAGIWDRERALQEIRVYPTYDQIAFITQESIDRMLTFRQAEEA